jgi:uncharacterized protein
MHNGVQIGDVQPPEPEGASQRLGHVQGKDARSKATLDRLVLGPSTGHSVDDDSVQQIEDGKNLHGITTDSMDTTRARWRYYRPSSDLSVAARRAKAGPIMADSSSENSAPSQQLAPRKLSGTARRLLFMLFRIVLILLIVLAWYQRSLIYQPTKSNQLAAANSSVPQAVVDVMVASHDGLTLHGWLALAGQKRSAVPPDAKALLGQGRPLVIVFPGNAGHRMMREHLIQSFGRLGADVMIFDYRGYGDNAGKPSEANMVRDARAIWNHATKDLSVAPRRIVLYGESLGGGVAVRLASDVCIDGLEPSGLVVQSTFNSLVDAGRHHFPLLPVSLILIDRFDSEQRIASVTCPLLQIHGSRDQIVPLRLGQQLFAAAPEKSSAGIVKRQVLLPNADHNDVYGFDLPLVIDAMKTFLTEVAKRSRL